MQKCVISRLWPTYIAWTNSVLTEFRLEILVKIIFWLQTLIVQWNVNNFCIRMNKRKLVWSLSEKKRKRCTEWMAFFWSLEVKACQKCFKKPYAQVGSKSVSSQVRTSVTQASLREPFLKSRSLAAACCHNMSRLTLGERPGLVSPLFCFLLLV